VHCSYRNMVCLVEPHGLEEANWFLKPGAWLGKSRGTAPDRKRLRLTTRVGATGYRLHLDSHRNDVQASMSKTFIRSPSGRLEAEVH